MPRTQNEITRLSLDTADASNGPKRLSDLRTALFGSNRRTSIIGYLGQNQPKWHDAWESYLRSKSINDSNNIEEERDTFHKVSSYI